MKLFYPFLSSFLIPLLILPPLQAQAPTPAAVPEGPGSVLHLILESQTTAAVNSQTAAGFMVEVTSADGHPVADVAVAFRLPDEEPTGTFPDGLHASVAYTNASGQAHSPAIHWGSVSGSASLRITAVKGPLHAGLLLAETIQAAANSPAANSVAASTTATNPRTPGTPSISAPQVVVVLVPSPTLPDPPAVTTLPAAEPPALHPGVVEPGIAKPMPKIGDVTKSGASPAPVAPKPEVSITNTPEVHPHSNKKWLILAVIAVGAGVGVALAMKGKGSTPAAAATRGGGAYRYSYCDCGSLAGGYETLLCFPSCLLRSAARPGRRTQRGLGAFCRPCVCRPRYTGQFAGGQSALDFRRRAELF